MEDASTEKSTAATSAGSAVGVTLFPSDYETVELITDQGEEILQQLSDDSAFVCSHRVHAGYAYIVVRIGR